MTNDALRILILYAVNEAPMGISPDYVCNIVSTATEEGNLNVENCMKDLVEKELLKSLIIDDVSLVTITNNGKLVVKQLQSNVSISLRKQISNKVLEEIARLRGELFVNSTYSKAPYSENGYIVTMELKDSNDVLMSMEIYAPSQLQAENISKNFKNNPNEIYSKIINILSNNK